MLSTEVVVHPITFAQRALRLRRQASDQGSCLAIVRKFKTLRDALPAIYALRHVDRVRPRFPVAVARRAGHAPHARARGRTRCGRGVGGVLVRLLCVERSREGGGIVVAVCACPVAANRHIWDNDLLQAQREGIVLIIRALVLQCQRDVREGVRKRILRGGEGKVVGAVRWRGYDPVEGNHRTRLGGAVRHVRIAVECRTVGSAGCQDIGKVGWDGIVANGEWQGIRGGVLRRRSHRRAGENLVERRKGFTEQSVPLFIASEIDTKANPQSDDYGQK